MGAMLMKALVIYDYLYGKTEKVARALASGMRDGGIDVECVRANMVDVGTLGAYDMIVIGGPTHSMGLSDAMKTFTKQLKGAAVKNKQAFAFDTKYDSRFAGSAGKKIEQRMKQHGMKVVVPHASAIVLGKEGPLKEALKHSSNRLGSS